MDMKQFCFNWSRACEMLHFETLQTRKDDLHKTFMQFSKHTVVLLCPIGSLSAMLSARMDTYVCQRQEPSKLSMGLQ